MNLMGVVSVAAIVAPLEVPSAGETVKIMAMELVMKLLTIKGC